MARCAANVAPTRSTSSAAVRSASGSSVPYLGALRDSSACVFAWPSKFARRAADNSAGNTRRRPNTMSRSAVSESATSASPMTATPGELYRAPPLVTSRPASDVPWTRADSSGVG